MLLNDVESQQKSITLADIRKETMYEENRCEK